MTVVAVEQRKFTPTEGEEQYDVLNLAADSRITRGTEVTTDLAPKILPIHMRITNAEVKHVELPPYGFAFAGSVTSAFVTHATAQHLLSGLFGDLDSPPPTVHEVSTIYAELADQHIREVGARLSSSDAKAALFESIICGYCPAFKANKAFHIMSSADDELKIDVTEIDLQAGTFRTGSGSASFDSTVAAMLEKGETPLAEAVVAKMIEQQIHRSVGGFVQFATVDHTGFCQCDVIHHDDGSELQDVKYLDFDLSKVHRPDRFKYGVRALTFGSKSFQQSDIRTTQ
jgi:hypothetical protein